MTHPDSTMRLQRFLAHAGIAARRKAEEYIRAGRVKVNGRVIREMGVLVDPRHDQVHFDGNRVQPEELLWLLLHKPTGTVCTAWDPEHRETVFDLVGEQGARLFTVGRLDFNTQGLLLLTNDGELAHALAHPKREVPRVYEVKVRGEMTTQQLDTLRDGVSLGGRMVKAQVLVLGLTERNTWLQMTLTQGQNHQIHRMLEAVGTRVTKIVRTAFGPLTLEGVRPGRYRTLTQVELDGLRELCGLPLTRRRPARRPMGRRARPPWPTGTTRPRRPAHRSEDPRPARPADDRRPPRSTDDRRPSRSTDDRRPPRSTDDRRPPRSTDDRRPPRGPVDKRPARPADDRRPPRSTDDRRPPRGPVDPRPPRKKDAAPVRAPDRAEKRAPRPPAKAPGRKRPDRPDRG